jgi:hypothetical protein
VIKILDLDGVELMITVKRSVNLELAGICVKEDGRGRSVLLLKRWRDLAEKERRDS